MRNIAIIPARSGSKGLKDKNIKELNGKPLLAYSIEAAKESGLFEEIMVSTDSEKYAKIAREYGAKVPFLRSKRNSQDNSTSWEVAHEVLDNYLKDGQMFDTMCMLQPTSPLRTEKDIVGAYNVLEEYRSEAVTSVCKVDHSPIWTMQLDDTMSLKTFRNRISGTGNRQEIGQYYRLNGAIYIRKIAYNNDKSTLLDDDECAYIMERECSVDIDEKIDFVIAQFIMQQGEKLIKFPLKD